MVWKKSERGLRMTGCPPQFSLDSTNIFLAFGNKLRIFSCTHGEILRTLEGHTEKITSINVHPSDPLIIFTASKDQTVRTWNLQTSECVSIESIGHPIAQMLLRPDISQVYIRTFDGIVFPYDLKEHVALPKIGDPDEKFIHFSINRNTGAAITDNKQLRVWHLQDPTSFQTYTAPHHLRKVCIPDDNQSILTSAGGMVYQWHVIAGPEFVDPSLRQPLVTAFHWHHTRISALVPTVDSQGFLTGGAEGVLVNWRFSGTKKFLPALKSVIIEISQSPDARFFSVLLRNNQFHLIDAVASSIVWTYNGVIRDLKTRPRSLAVDIKDRSIITTGTTATIQFIDIAQDRVTSFLDIASNNVVGRMENEPIVTNFAMSEDGSHFATYELQLEKTIAPVLKFWTKGKDRTWTLSLRVEDPHEDEMVSMSFGKDERMTKLITCSKTAGFRVWVEQKHWTSVHSGKFRGDLAATQVLFSPDSSLFAISFGHILTFWNPDTYQVVKEFSHQTPIRSFVFVPKTPFVVTVTNDHVTVINLMSSAIQWKAPMRATCIACHPSMRQFAVAMNVVPKDGESGSSAVVLFDVDSPIPKHIWKVQDEVSAMLMLTPSMMSIQGAASSISCLTTSQRFFLLEDFQFQDAISPLPPVTSAVMRDVQNRFEGLIKVGLNLKSDHGQKASENYRERNQEIQKLLDIPSLSMPMPSILSKALMDLLVIRDAGDETTHDEMANGVKKEPKHEVKKESKSPMVDEGLDELGTTLKDDYESMVDFFRREFAVSKLPVTNVNVTNVTNVTTPPAKKQTPKKDSPRQQKVITPTLDGEEDGNVKKKKAKVHKANGKSPSAKKDVEMFDDPAGIMDDDDASTKGSPSPMIIKVDDEISINKTPKRKNSANGSAKSLRTSK